MPPGDAAGVFGLFFRTQIFSGEDHQSFEMCCVMSRMWSGADGKYVSGRWLGPRRRRIAWSDTGEKARREAGRVE